MKRIILITLASLALLVTVATAHQNGYGNRHMSGNKTMQQQYGNGNCSMGGNMMMGQRMMGQQMMNGTQNPTGQSVDTNWKANPSYQGQVVTSGQTEK